MSDNNSLQQHRITSQDDDVGFFLHKSFMASWKISSYNCSNLQQKVPRTVCVCQAI